MKIRPRAMQFVAALLFASVMAPCALSQETPAPSPNATTQAPAPQDQKSGQEPKNEISVQDTPNTFKVRVNLVQVHVVVRDDAGKPVAGLHKEDFQLFDNNKLQTISAFGIEDAESRKERTEAAKTQPNNGATDTQAAEALPERFIALTFDDVHLETGDMAPMKIAANAFLDSIAPNDRVGFFTSSGVVTQDFTSDKQLLKQALSQVISHAHRLRSGGCPDVSYDIAVQPEGYQIAYQEAHACAPELPPQQLALIVSQAMAAVKEEGEAETLNVYREFDLVLRLLASKPGDRVLLLVSPGFLPRHTFVESDQITDRAVRSNIVINALDARGLYAPDFFGDIGQPYGQQSPAIAGQVAGALLNIQTDKPMVLADLADATGGRFFHNSNDLAGGLKQLGIAPEVSYLLGFSPQLLKTDGKFHDLKVTLTGKQKYAVEARRGYFAPKKLEDPAEIAKEEIREAVFSSDEIVGLPFTTQTQYFKSSPTAAQLAIVAHVDLSGVRFRKADGRNCDDVTVATVLFDENGNYVAGGERLEQLRLYDATLQKVSRTGLFLKSATYEVKPGRYLVRQVVREAEGSQISARSTIVVIPD